MTRPRVSIVIPVLNGMATLPELLDRLAAQRFDGDVEILAIDSGSRDGSAELLRARADLLIEIAPAEFDHGLTRNLGVERATGDLVVLLVQDALPASTGWLRALSEPLRADSTLAGTYARQVPRPDASGFARWVLERWAGASDAPRVSRVPSREAFLALAPADRHAVCLFDNVCACIRRSVWLQVPFRSTPIAEDLEWARDVLLAGFGLAYVPEAVVLHSHDRSVRYEFRRTCLVHRRLAEMFGLRLVPDAASLARAVASTTVAHVRHADSLAVLPRALALGLAWPLGQYLGARAATSAPEEARS